MIVCGVFLESKNFGDTSMFLDKAKLGYVWLK